MCPINSPEAKSNNDKMNLLQNFTFCSSQCQKSYYDPKENLQFPLMIQELQHFPLDLQQLFISQGKQGKIALRYPEDIGKTLQEQNLIQTLVNSQKLNLIIRNFPPNHSFRFLSLQFASQDQLSWELIAWTLKSLYYDRMTQSEKLLFSRLKEVFAMQITQAEWQFIIKGIKELARKNNGWILLSGLTNNQVPNLFVQDYIDPVTQNQSMLIRLNPIEYSLEPQDACPLNYQDQPLWLAFRNFVQSFFSVKEMNFNWTSSIQTSGNINKKKKNTPSINYNRPAIPGGKYGFAQFLQFCGNHPIFQVSSLGKLSMMIQEAVARKIIVYYRTLLVRNKEPISEFQWNLNYKIQQFSELDQFSLTMQNNIALQDKFTTILNQVKELLFEYQEGLPLAKIPKLLQSRGIYLNLAEFGLTKLKNLLGFIQNVTIDNPGSTLAMARILDSPVEKIIKPKTEERLYMKIRKELKETPEIELACLWEKIPVSFNVTLQDLFQFLEQKKNLLHIEIIMMNNLNKILIVSTLQQPQKEQELLVLKKTQSKLRQSSSLESPKLKENNNNNYNNYSQECSYSEKRKPIENNIWFFDDSDEIAKVNWGYSSQQETAEQSWNDLIKPCKEDYQKNYIKNLK